MSLEDELDKQLAKDARREEPKRWRVTLDNDPFVWRWEVYAPTEEVARCSFVHQWAGMMVTHDKRPSELVVERVKGSEGI